MNTDWEARYQQGETEWDKGAPSPGLVDWLQTNSPLVSGRVLVPGCGFGHDVRAWSSPQTHVLGLDLAPSAIRGCHERTPLEFNCQYRLGDFLTDTPEQPFDWIFEHTLFCAIHPSQRDAYLQAILRWLKPGGHFLAVHYLIPDTDGPPFGTDHPEILQRFSPHLELLQDWVPRSYPNRTGLERMYWWKKPDGTL